MNKKQKSGKLSAAGIEDAVTFQGFPHILRQRRTLMKKLLSLLLALTMLILPCAFAENAEDADNT